MKNTKRMVDLNSHEMLTVKQALWAIEQLDDLQGYAPVEYSGFLSAAGDCARKALETWETLEGIKNAGAKA